MGLLERALDELTDHDFDDKVRAFAGNRIDHVRDWLRRLRIDLPGLLKKVICAYGYTQIDEKHEREKLADKITDWIGTVMPPQLLWAWPFVKRRVRKVVLASLEDAAEKGEAYCTGVEAPALVPIPDLN